MAARPVIEITFCRLCGWGLRAGWMAQELLTTFAEEVGSVMLTPDASGGVFDVRVDGQVIWSRKERGRFPESKELKQLVRDRIAPDRSLGHSDSAWCPDSEVRRRSRLGRGANFGIIRDTRLRGFLV